jgi:hypothetical protein
VMVCPGACCVDAFNSMEVSAQQHNHGASQTRPSRVVESRHHAHNHKARMAE